MSLRALLPTLLIGLLPLVARCAPVDSNARADFEWFSKLGFPDVKGCEFVRVATGLYTQVVDEPATATNRYINGFLLATNGDNFTIFSLGLATRTFTNSAPGTTPTYERVGMEPADVERFVQEELNSLRSPPKNDYFPSLDFETSIPERAEAFVLAWACWRQGLEAEAQELYNQAKVTPSRHSFDQAEPVFHIALENNFAQVLTARATDAFGDPAISRPELLRRFETILTNYPDSECSKSALETATVLKRMIAEDQEHERTGPKDLNRLPAGEKVRELIFRLRDQNAHQYTEPGSVDIFEDWLVWSKQHTTNTPAHQLVAIGYAAVPQLIQALGSRSPTRCVGVVYSDWRPGYVLTVGDCAEQILQRITGKGFARAGWSKDGRSYSYDPSAERKAAETWWAQFQKKGEKQMLTEEVATPSNADAPAEAVLLRERYPDIATTALIHGIRAATNSSIAAKLIRELATLDQEQGAEFLKEELHQGPSLESRVASAFALRHREKNLAIDSMIDEWQKVPNQVNILNYEWEWIIDFLGTCDSSQAVKALAANLRDRSPRMRLHVISVLGTEDSFTFGYNTNLPPSPETLDAMEKCLVAELDDTGVLDNYSAVYNDTIFSNPRLCDMDRYFLAKRWPKRYTFNSAPFKSPQR